MSAHSRRSIPFYFSARRHFPRPFRSPSPQVQPELALDIASHDLPRPRLRELREDLEINNIIGRMVTFDIATGRWVDWHRPMRHFLNGSTRPVAAGGLESYEDLVRPICPHASNGFRENCEMHVRRKTRNHKVTWVFQASHEGCDFIVHIPDLPRENLVLRDLRLRGNRNRNRNCRRVAQSNVNTTSNSSSGSSPVTALNRRVTRSSLRTQSNSLSSSSSYSLPVASTSSNSTPPSSQTPSSSSLQTSSSPHKPWRVPTDEELEIITEVVGQRINSNHASNSSLRRVDTRNPAYENVLQHVSRMEDFLNVTCPSRSHDAADRDLPPIPLIPYHPISSPTPLADDRFYNTAVGYALREWNSPAGISIEAWDCIIASNVLCPSCLRMYSVDGLIAHAKEGVCGRPIAGKSLINIRQLPYFPTHLIAENDQPPLALVPFHHPSPSFDVFLTSMIGRASLEWNSSLGLTMDAWYLLATAKVICVGCQKVRSFDGDCAHRDGAGEPKCLDEVDVSMGDDEVENVPVLDKGKGRAHD